MTLVLAHLMTRIVPRFGLALLATVTGMTTQAFAAGAVALPNPAVDMPASKEYQTAVFAGGCFWGVEAVFRHVKGVSSAISGYAGGAAKNANYEAVSAGRTDHAEAVQVTFDPAQVSYGQLLKVLFSVAHDPTQLNRQGPDWGTQYRSAIFYMNDDQKRVAMAYVDQLNKAKVFSRPIVTQITSLPAFYTAEPYHQDYVARHPTQPYVAMNDLPKLTHLREQFPALYSKK